MKTQRGYGLLLFLGLLTSLASGCMPVAAYQKMYLNDQDMQLSNRPIEHFETNIESYREGAAGAAGGKAGGGCGCN